MSQQRSLQPFLAPGDIIPEPRAASSRNGGRHHPGMGGRHHVGTVGGIIPEWWAASIGISTLTPNETLTSYSAWSPVRFSGRLALILEGLRRAGLPE